MLERVEFDNPSYQLALDAVEVGYQLDFLERWLDPEAKSAEASPTPDRLQYQIFYSSRIKEGNFYIPLSVTPEMHANLVNGTRFPQEEVDRLKSNGLSYSPAAYRSFFNYFTHLQKAGEINTEYQSTTMTFFAIKSYLSFGLISQREYDRLPKTGLALTSNLIDSFSSDMAFMPNRKIFTYPEDIQYYPLSQAGHPRILLHGRFNNFPTLQYFHTIFSVTSEFNKLPSLVIGIDGDSATIDWKGQIPFMNQVFRAGFYTFSPLVEAVYLADEVKPDNFNEYWGGVYRDMDIDYLAIEESDPNREEKVSRLSKYTQGKGKVFTTRSMYENLPRLSSTDIKGGDKEAISKLARHWTEMTLEILARNPIEEAPHYHFIERGSKEIPQPPLFIS